MSLLSCCRRDRRADNSRPYTKLVFADVDFRRKPVFRGSYSIYHPGGRETGEIEGRRIDNGGLSRVVSRDAASMGRRSRGAPTWFHVVESHYPPTDGGKFVVVELGGRSSSNVVSYIAGPKRPARYVQKQRFGRTRVARCPIRGRRGKYAQPPTWVERDEAHATASRRGRRIDSVTLFDGLGKYPLMPRNVSLAISPVLPSFRRIPETSQSSSNVRRTPSHNL